MVTNTSQIFIDTSIYTYCESRRSWAGCGCHRKTLSRYQFKLMAHEADVSQFIGDNLAGVPHIPCINGFAGGSLSLPITILILFKRSAITSHTIAMLELPVIPARSSSKRSTESDLKDIRDEVGWTTRPTILPVLLARTKNSGFTDASMIFMSNERLLTATRVAGSRSEYATNLFWLVSCWLVYYVYIS